VHRIVFLVLIFQPLPLVNRKHRYNAKIVASLEDNVSYDKKKKIRTLHTFLFSSFC